MAENCSVLEFQSGHSRVLLESQTVMAMGTRGPSAKKTKTSYSDKLRVRFRTFKVDPNFEWIQESLGLLLHVSTAPPVFPFHDGTATKVTAFQPIALQLTCGELRIMTNNGLTRILDIFWFTIPVIGHSYTREDSGLLYKKGEKRTSVCLDQKLLSPLVLHYQ